MDGKTLRGSGHGGEDSRHLLAALDHAHGVVMGWVDVGAKTNEIPLFTTLLDRLDIQDAVITADALHAQREHATYLHRRGARYLLVVKRNQPTLHARLAALPWRDVATAYDKQERGHGRTERRTLKVTAIVRGLAFPPAAQALQIVRRRKLNGKWSRETCYAVTSLAAAFAPDRWRRLVTLTVPPAALDGVLFSDYEQLKRLFYTFMFRDPNGFADAVVARDGMAFLDSAPSFSKAARQQWPIILACAPSGSNVSPRVTS